MSIYTANGEQKASHIHSLVPTSERPYRYICLTCGARLKVLNGVRVDKLRELIAKDRTEKAQ